MMVITEKPQARAIANLPRARFDRIRRQPWNNTSRVGNFFSEDTNKTNQATPTHHYGELNHKHKKEEINIESNYTVNLDWNPAVKKTTASIPPRSRHPATTPNTR
jgi:hypothetical protein